MKKVVVILLLFSVLDPLFSVAQSANYKHPFLDVNHAPALQLSKMHWLSREEIVNNSYGEQIAFLKGETILNSSGKRMGKVAKNAIYYQVDGVAELYNQSITQSPCKQIGSNGIGLNRSYKNQFGVHCQ